MILVVDGGAGKMSLCKQLMGQPFDTEFGLEEINERFITIGLSAEDRRALAEVGTTVRSIFEDVASSGVWQLIAHALGVP